MSDPTLWDVMMVDPTIPIDRSTLNLVIRDQRRPSRAYLYPVARVVSRAAVATILTAKRLCPVRFTAPATMDRLCLWFLRRFVSPDAVTLLVRHFIVETNLLNFCVRNSVAPGVAEAALRPTTLSGLGDHAVIEHDLNVYRVLFSLGLPGRATPSRSVRELDFSMLDIPPIDPERESRRLLNLDIQTALCLMNIAFVFCLSSSQYRRAVHSLRLDSSLLGILAALTGDQQLLAWAGPPSVRVDSTTEVPKAVYDHAVLCEYAHARLRQLAAQRPARRSGESEQGFEQAVREFEIAR